MMLQCTVYTGLVKEACGGWAGTFPLVCTDEKTEAEGESGDLTKFSWLLSRTGL